MLFKEINSFVQPDKVVVLFDEIDALALDRTNANDLREMGRATSAMLKGFDRMSENVILLDRYLDKLKLANRDIRLFRKIIKLMPEIPYPGDLKNMIKTSVAFSNPHDGMDYFRRLYYAICNEKPEDLKKLQSQKFTVREIEILVGRSKSSVARDLKEGVINE